MLTTRPGIYLGKIEIPVKQLSRLKMSLKTTGCSGKVTLKYPQMYLFYDVSANSSFFSGMR